MIRLDNSNLFVGNKQDFITSGFMFQNDPSWVVIAACKSAHKDFLGYDKNLSVYNFNYLYVKDENRLILNLVDARTIKYIPKEIFNVAINFANESIKDNKKIFIYCDEGRSRSMTLALFILKNCTTILDAKGEDYNEAMKFMSLLTFDEFHPNAGMLEFIKLNYNKIFIERD